MELPKNWEHVDQVTVTMLVTLERHAYFQMAKLIDQGQVDEARKIADLLKVVGLI